MGLVEKDPLVRLLEELTKRKAATQASLAGGRPAEALASVEQARKTLGGALASTVERVDGATVVTLLGKEKAAAYAELARLEAEVRRALGEDAAAGRAEARAVEVERAVAR
ncbi:MAG TPA: hypothetical protein VHS09_04585 [Polyangiaceae bacterium]|jgi:hypothetical protein|nr:hypothetical protein [Polyangiaceae bacterium]